MMFNAIICFIPLVSFIFIILVIKTQKMIKTHFGHFYAYFIYLPEQERTIESILGSEYYNAYGEWKIKHFHKPDFNAFNKAFKLLRSEQIAALADWNPNAQEVEHHTLLVSQGKRSLDSEPQPNWLHRFKKIHGCVFQPPKIKQLTLWLISKTLRSGDRILRYNHKGTCPFCNTPATPDHMFCTCPTVADVWAQANTLGLKQWPKYLNFDYDQVGYWLNTYDPPVLFKVAFVWAIWTTWCSYFYDIEDPLPPDEEMWFNLIIDRALKEFTSRLYEAAPMISWIQVVANRRETRADSGNREGPFISEKEFLLAHSQQINANPAGVYDISAATSDHTLNYEAWAGANYLVKSDRSDPDHPRLTLNHHAWPQHRSSSGRPPDLAAAPAELAGLAPPNFIAP